MEPNITTKNNTMEPAVESVISTPHIDAKIMKQLEYYFSDANLPFDDFLLNEIKTDNGWVEISVLLTFKRLKSISTDTAVIASVVQNASNTILEIDYINKKIRRKLEHVIPVATREFINEMIERSIYCKGFPKSATKDEILDFADTFGDKTIIKTIRRKFKNQNFKGSLYFTFNTKEQADVFLKQESVKYDNIELKRMWEKDFIIEKKKEYLKKLLKQEQKIKAETEKYFKKGYLIKIDKVKENTTVNSVKRLCSSLNWHVAYVKIVNEKNIVWIRLQPVKKAKDLLEEFSNNQNDLKTLFSIPEENVEQQVLNEMTKEIKEVLDMKEKMKKEKKKNRLKK